jgi:tetratricopeptide (TPR) repeat protein
MIFWLLEMGDLARNVMDYQQSEALYTESLTLARSQSERVGIPYALQHLGFLKLFLGEFASSTDYLQQSVRLHQGNNDLFNVAQNMTVLATAYTFLGQLPQARQCIEESLAAAKVIPSILPFAMATRSRINIWMGKYEAAQIEANRMFSFSDEADEHTGHWEVTPYGPLAWLSLVQLDLAAARENLRKFVEYNRQFNTSGAQEWTATHQATLSRAEWGLGQHVTARQHLYEALTVAVKIRAFITLLHVLPIVPVFLAAENDVQHKARAIEIYALAQSHPFIANCQFFYDIAGKDIEAVEAGLPAEVVTAARARGQALDYWETAESLLTELTELGWAEAG